MKIAPFFALLCLGLPMACAIEEGDVPLEAHSSTLGNGSKIHDISGPADWEQLKNQNSVKCKAIGDKDIYVSGVTVEAIDRYDETNGGAVGNYYLQDTTDSPKPYQGMTMFGASFSPPNLRVSEGDVVDILGVLSEFPGPPPPTDPFPYCRTLPEISGSVSFRFEGKTPPAIKVTLDQLKTYKTARPYIGMLVRVESIAIADIGCATDDVDPQSKRCKPGIRFGAPLIVGQGIAKSNVPTLTNELFELQTKGPDLKDGTQIKSVTGILTYFYGFHIAPRSAEDIEI